MAAPEDLIKRARMVAAGRAKIPITEEEAERLIEALRRTYIKRGKPVLPKGELTSEQIPTREKEEIIERKIKETGLPFSDTETLIRLKGYDPYRLTSQQQDELVKTLDELKKVNPGDRMRYLYEGKVIFEDKAIQKEYDNILRREGNIRNGRFGGGRRRIAEGKEYVSPLNQSLRLTKPQTIKDVRFTLGDMEVNSGIPFYNKHYADIMRASNKKDKEAERIFKIIRENITERPSHSEQANITAYFEALYQGKTPPRLTSEEAKLALNIRKVMDDFKPFVQKYRFLAWVESKMAGENKGLGITDIPDVKQETLEEGFRIMQEGGDIDAWLDKQKFGVVTEGYVPRQLLTGKLHFPLYNIGRFTKRMLRPRTAKEDMSDIPLLIRARRYINNMLNLKYLEKPVSELDRDLQALFEKRNIPSATTDMIQHWVNKMKGYPQRDTTLNKILRGGQRWLHRAITTRARLWFRNLFQAKITPPFKTPIFHPRSARAKLSSIEQADIDYFFENTNQFEAMKREYLYFLGEGRVDLPLARQYVGLSERVGNVYALSDMWNRDQVYSETVVYVKPYIDQYLQRKISLAKLKRNTGYNLMKSYEQKRFLNLLEKNPDELRRFIGDWNSGNSQWMYKMKERGLMELSTTEPAFFNLFVWPKSMGQLTLNLGDKVIHGRTFAERRSGLVGIIGLIIACELAQKIITKVYGRYKARRYQGYDILQSTLWSLGGATVSEMNETMEVFGSVVYAYRYGDEAQQKRAKAKALRQIDGMSTTFLPFWDSTLALMEVMTEKEYISPLYNLFHRKAKPMERNKLQVLQHLLFRQTEKEIKKGFVPPVGAKKSGIGGGIKVKGF